MADLKISALTAATTPLAGTEVLPIVQGGVTTKVAVSNLTAGRAVTAASVNKVAITAPATASTLTIADGKTLTASNSLTLAGTDATTHTFPTTSATIARTDAAQTFTGDQTLATGNLVIGTAGKGIDFSATPGTGTSELLADYEQGTFTPVISGNTTAGTGTYGTQNGSYTKIGNRVFVNIRIDWSAHTGTGTTALSGYPFATGATTFGSFAVRFDAGFIVTVGNVPMCAFLPPSSQAGNLIQYELATGNSGPMDLSATGSVTVNGHYDVA